MSRLLKEDLSHVLTEAASALETFRGKRILITGATGFFGRWALETLLAANEALGLEVKLVATSRDPETFARQNPWLGNNPCVSWLKGTPAELTVDAARRQVQDPKMVEADAVVHLVTEANLASTAAEPLRAMNVIVESTRGALEFARAVGAKRFLFTSSGAVYGPRPVEMLTVSESFNVAPETTDLRPPYAAAGNAKRYAELLCAAYAKQHGLGAVIARCFTFVGPHLPLGGKFAVGNFLADALAGRELVIRGDGTAVRSYLYAADLAVWLLTLLARGEPGQAYNVGSEQPVTIRELAQAVAEASGKTLPVRVLGVGAPGSVVDRYIPDTGRARRDLGLAQKIGLAEAVHRTWSWLIASPPH